MRTITIAVILSLVLAPAAISAELNAEEKSVWELEEAYWVYVKNNDIDSYLTLWDERFVGWPGFSKTPMGKESITDWISPLHTDPARIYDYELTQMAVRSFGDIVVAHYLVQEFYRSAETGEIISEDVPYRITHTWRKRNGQWQIITGMSGSLVADE